MSITIPLSASISISKDDADTGARQVFTYGPNLTHPNTSIDIADCATVILRINGDGNTVGVRHATTLRLNNATLNDVNVSNSGLGGLDTGTVANNMDYYLYCVSDGTNYSYVWSTNVNFPDNTSFPTYIYAARLGWNHTNASGHFLQLRKTNYQYSFCNSGANIPEIASGSTSGSVSAVLLTNGTTVGYVSPQAHKVNLLLKSVNASSFVSVCKNNTSPLTDGLVTQNSSAATQMKQVDIMLESAFVYYNSTDANAKMYLLGFEDAAN